MGTLHEEHNTFLIISYSVLPRMRNVLDKSCKENQNTHFMLNNFFFWMLCHLWDNVDIYCRAGQATDDACALHAGCLRLWAHAHNM